MKNKRVLRYSLSGLGYRAWTPEAGSGLPDLWFGSFEQLRRFADENGYTLRALA